MSDSTPDIGAFDKRPGVTDAERVEWWAHCATSPAWAGYEIPDLDELDALGAAYAAEMRERDALSESEASE